MTNAGAKLVLGSGAVVVALVTGALRIIGTGTILSLSILLAAWSLVAAVSSSKYADQHHLPVWIVAVALSTALFLIPGVIIYWTALRRWPAGAVGMLAAWLLLYVSSLLFLFPAKNYP